MTGVEIDLSERVAVVTGGTRGIGWAIAESLAEAGAAVVPTSRTEEHVEDAVATLRAEGTESIAVPTDVTDLEAVETLVDTVVDRFDAIDILVNNAGINPLGAMGRPEAINPTAFQRPIDVNLLGALYCTNRAGEHLLEREGTVINVASTAGLVGVKRQHAYVASKHALVGLTKSMAMDWAPTARVNAIAPGYVETGLTEPVMEMDDIYDKIIAQTPFGRFGQPEEVAGIALFLASDLSSYMTGACVVVDGGLTV